jgi:hypothetical protein
VTWHDTILRSQFCFSGVCFYDSYINSQFLRNKKMQKLHWSHTHTSDGLSAPTPLFDFVSAFETSARYFKLKIFGPVNISGGCFVLSHVLASDKFCFADSDELRVSTLNRGYSGLRSKSHAIGAIILRQE